jgi:leader peptidase (prepilin peptidase)/N-methyltransferase
VVSPVRLVVVAGAAAVCANVLTAFAGRRGWRTAPRPIPEVSAAALGAGAAAVFDDAYAAALLSIFFTVVLVLSLIDARYRILPNAITYPSVVAFAVAIAVGDAVGRAVDVWSALVGLLALGGVLFVLAVLPGGGMGMGDVKLGALIGLVIGSQGLRDVAVAGFVGILAGGLGAIVALALGRSRKALIPFGPYLAAGAAVAALWGPRLGSR